MGSLDIGKYGANVDFIVFTPEDESISFSVSEDGSTISSLRPKQECYCLGNKLASFWFDNGTNGEWAFYLIPNIRVHERGICDGPGYLDVPYVVNMMLRKIEDVGE